MTIIRMERGETAPFASTVQQLADALAVPPESLAALDELENRKRRRPR